MKKRNILLIGLVFCICISFSVYQAYRSRKISTWPQAEGRVLYTANHHPGWPSYTGRHVLCAYTYVVDGCTYEGKGHIDVKQAKCCESDCRVAVFYNPDRPSESALCSPERLEGFPLVFLGGVLCVLMAAKAYATGDL